MVWKCGESGEPSCRNIDDGTKIVQWLLTECVAVLCDEWDGLGEECVSDVWVKIWLEGHSRNMKKDEPK